MYARKRRILPLILCLVIVFAAAMGIWTWYDNNVDRSGWVEKKGVRYYRDFYADPVSGWLELPEGRYYLHEDGTPHYGWQDVDGITYYFDDDGAMHTGWLQKDGQIHYFGGNGTMVVGWLWLEEGRYYLEEGKLLTGWQEINSTTYYFHEDGTAALDFAEIDGKTYYFDDGILVTSLFQKQGVHYYFDDDGVMQTGWAEFPEGIRYYREDGTGAVGWQEIDGQLRYFDSDLLMVTGEATIDGRPYRFREDGTIHSGWEERESGKRYFKDDGSMAVGVTEIDGAHYHFDRNGYMTTGWQDVGEYSYYFHTDGTAAVGPTVIDGETHYFSPKGIEVILVNGINPVPAYYEQNLVTIEENHEVDRRCYDALVNMLADCKAAGIEYNFNSGYRTLDTQILILESRTLEHMKNFQLDFDEAREKALDTVAIPGTSEHHLGLAVDLLGDEAIEWFTEHCWDYGFIVRYTEEKEDITGIIDEPWHFRYVGTAVSLDMKGTGLCLEEYLGAEAVDTVKIKEVHGETWYEENFTMFDEEFIQDYLSGKK